MNDTLTTLQRGLRDEAQRLREEASKLDSAAKAALAAYSNGGGNGSAPKATKRRKAAKRGRPKGSGKRGEQVLTIIQANPGIKVAEIAQKMGIKTNYLYRVLPNLPVVKQGDGWVPKPE